MTKAAFDRRDRKPRGATSSAHSKYYSMLWALRTLAISEVRSKNSLCF
jgi:hypothetical protein